MVGEPFEKSRHVEAVDHRMMHFDCHGHGHTPAAARAAAEHDPRN
jgi:hypothetical protein